jgi:hypothetical protein
MVSSPPPGLMTCRINKEKEIVVDEKEGKLTFRNS